MHQPRGRTRRLLLPLIAVAVPAVGCSYTTRDALPPTPISASAESSDVYAADGTLIHTFHAEVNRRNVSLDEIPMSLRDAVVAIEDERFYRHNGVDVRAVARAARENAAAGEVAEGGSTITQQYVKQVLLADDSRTIERKLREASLALQLERHYSKDRILELYLNAVYFGNGAYGVAAAAQQYFGKPVGEVTLAESALLAGLIQRPTATDPYDALPLATARRNLVLDRMAENSFVAEADAEAAKQQPVVLASSTVPAAERYEAAYFLEVVKQWLLDDPRFGATKEERHNLLFGGGLKIQTTVDLEAQRAAEAAANEILPNAERDPDVALVSIEPDTGYIRAMVGGRDFFGPGKAAKVNLALSLQQTGSAFKPLVLAAALADGIPPTRRYPAPGRITIQPHPPYTKPYPVGNYSDSGPPGVVDLVEGTVHSYNTLYAQLFQDVGPEEAIELAAELGIRSPDLIANPAAVLGTNLVTAVDMASAFGTFANRGVHVPPVLVTRITRADGTVLYSHQHEQTRVLDVDVADTVTAVLQQVVTRGTGTAAAFDHPSAGKTGTTQDYHDAWFVGYTPDLATAVWVGHHEGNIPMRPPTTPINVTGGSYPARIWQRFMRAALAGTPITPFHAPPADTFVPEDTVPDPSADEELLDQIDDYYEGLDPELRPLPGAPSTTATTTPSRGSGRVVVPDVTGRSVESGVETLRASGFSVSRRIVDGSTNIRSGTIVAQTPSGGSLAASGSTVTIDVVRSA